ncbi:MAG: hypothetical protein Harvfovirus46_11 [Harvfovirus sp.]|uniref:chitin synthase n=1 Tax=Harvfovirus sp. TaxID=2487768 RepID=A0A3G5A335_9VIRU|nr:MAG: hypothetical protein Harvfovirus46_11 [Harvfovirus sp.]
MHCSQCKTELKPDFIFCQNCGKKIDENSESKSVSSSPKRRSSVKSPHNFSIATTPSFGADSIRSDDVASVAATQTRIPEGAIDHGSSPAYNQKFEHTICREFKGQTHFRPKPNCKYWAQDKPIVPVVSDEKRSDVAIQIEAKKNNLSNDKMLTILVPFYNESASELLVTLDTLHQDFSTINALGFDIHILLVMDGWWKSSESMKKLMKDFFKCNTTDVAPWWDAIKPIPADADPSECVSTFIVQRMTAGGESIAPIYIGDKSMKISLVVKRDNRKKINAHDWMLSSFAEFYNAHFVFLTDCGTIFEKKCLTLLVKELLKRPDCTAVTGRQRVMTPEQQGSDECWFSYEGFLRGAQRYDYESSQASYAGAFSLCGMLAVLPGPAGLYRYNAIKKECVGFYLDSVGLHPGEVGYIMGNLFLAEDRVLSYGAVVKTGPNAYTCFVPEAIFYFAAETLPLMLFQQRRRWINGTIAGYVWLLSKPSIIWDSGLRPWNKPLLTMLLICQLFMYIGVALSPGIFVTSFYWSLLWIDSNFASGQLENYYFCEIVYSLYLLMYLSFAIRHSSPERKPPVSSSFVKFVTFANMIAMIVIIVSMTSGLMVTYQTRTADTGININDVLVLFVLSTIFGPLLLALLHSFTSFTLMIRSIVPFYLMLPTMVIYIGVYALSRTWDLSWGNRPSEKSSLKGTMTAEQRKTNGENIQKMGRNIAYGLMLANCFVTFLLLESKERRVYVLILAIFIFTWSNIQMIFSSIYFIGRNTRRLIRIAAVSCCVKCLKIYTKKQWYAGTKN